jgi:hypothetical protein
MRKVFEDDNIAFVFNHLRNFLICVTVFSVGVYLHQNPREAVFMPAYWFEGILISMVGLSLILLNLTHAIKKVIKAGMNVWTAAPVAVLYVIVFLRILGVLTLLKSPV